MYFITLSVSATALLVSSVITIVILLRKQFKQWINTPLHILSISDVLFSIFTSGILFINYTGKIACTNFNNGTGTYYLNDSTWNEDVKIQKIKLETIDADFSTIINENNLNIIPECNIIYIITKYGMLFFPFTNSFVSLLTFSVQCNLNVFSLKNQCSKFLQFQERIHQTLGNIDQSQPDNAEKCEIPIINKVFKMQLDFVLNLRKSEKLLIVKQKFAQIFKCIEIKKGKRVTSILLVSQWITPILIIGILYLTHYDNKNDIKDMENIQCFTERNFFFNKCYNNIIPISIAQKKVTSSTYPTTFHKDYINNEDLIKSSDLNDTKVNEIISKVQNIVKAVLNETENILLTEDKNSYSLTNFKNDINLQDSTILQKYDTNKDMSIIEDNLNKIDTNIIEKLQAVIKDNQDVNKAPYNASIISDDQMYAEIQEHIHNIPMKYNITGYHKNNSQYEEMLKQNVLKDLQHNSTLHDQNVLSVIKIIIYKNDNISKIIQGYVTNECYMSIKFIKLHLLIFVFIIYFLPILFSSVLHQHGKLNCQIVLENLKAKYEILLNNINFNVINEIAYIDPGKATTSTQNFKCVKGDFEESINNCISLEETRIFHNDYNKKNDKYDEHNEHYHISFDRKKKLYLNTINQVRNILKLFDIIKVSLLCGILLWTPILLEFLLKVFTLSNIPEWLMNITCLSVTMFGILRNICNLKMIKLQEINTNIIKTNTIHPVV